MDKRTIEVLEELQKQLQHVDSVSEADRPIVEHLRQDIESLLANSGKAPAPGSDSVVTRLEDAVERFEVSHPALTAVMGRVIKSLGDMGI